MAKRRPNPEQQTSDRSTVAGCAQILGPLATRYPAQLDAALTLLRAFAASKVELPAKRKVTKAKQSFDDVLAAEADVAIMRG
ncbi:MAG TPA: hypothetical protein VHP62_01880 [Usitatibacter sp.]|jgi:hypothetical protein|nr:hypothetical protein [Usitatibacter sp.]